MRRDTCNYVVCAALLALLAAPAYGESSGIRPPVAPEDTGTVDFLNLDNGRIVVGDSTFLVSPDTPVVLPTGKITTVGALKKGTLVGYTSVSPGKGHSTITRIWVLPKDYVPPAND